MWSWNNRALVSHPMKPVHMALTGQMADPLSSSYLPWCASQSPSRTTWPGTLSGPPVLLNLDSVCQICFYTHLTQTDLRVCAHITTSHTTHTRHTTHIHIIILGMPQDVTYSPYSVSPSAWFWPWNPVWPYCLERSNKQKFFRPKELILQAAVTWSCYNEACGKLGFKPCLSSGDTNQSGSSSLNRDCLWPKLSSPHACHWIQNHYHWRVTAERFSYSDGCNLLLLPPWLCKATALDTSPWKENVES